LASKADAAPTRQLLKSFDDLHRAAFGVPAVIAGGKDAAILASLWKSHPDHLGPVMQAFFRERDPWIAAHGGFTVGMLRHRFAALLLKQPKAAPDDDWYTECQQHCGGRCGSRYQHGLFGKHA